jgi:hypothetical protein
MREQLYIFNIRQARGIRLGSLLDLMNPEIKKFTPFCASEGLPDGH